MRINERYGAIISWFEQNMPIAESELHYCNAYELLVAVILSAQCTDKRVNMTTPALFDRYPTAALLAQASVEEIYQLIRSISYPNNKARHLVAMAQRLDSVYAGVVPEKVEELTTLAGVGRKTAHVIASVIFNQPTMAVDTHVFRVANRLGLTSRATTPLQVEQQLVRYIPEQLIGKAHHWLILHGRYVCMARRPQCVCCGLTHWCRFYSTKRQKEFGTAIDNNK